MIVVTFDPSDDRHRPRPICPERPGRLVAVHEALHDAGVGDEAAARPATRDELLAVHDGAYLDALASMSRSGGGDLDLDTSMSEGSWETALLSAGAGMVGAAALVDGAGGHRCGFVATRPPGHHAGRAAPAGFCLLNNIAVVAAYLAGRGERVAIFDWDVHHGDGTQAIFWDDPRVLYVSVHEWPLYPGSGRPAERGGPAASGLTINIPLASGATGDVYLAAFDEVAEPAFERFEPTWILVSAGFDAHRADPLAGMALSAGDYGLLTERLMAAGKPLLLFLEGGYDLEALRACVVTCVTCLAGEGRLLEMPTSGGPGRQTVTRFAASLLSDPWEGT